MTDNLNDLTRRLRSALTVATDLADKAEDIRYMPPKGYTPDREHDGISRPTETLVVAHEDREITPRINQALSDLRQAALRTERAARQLNDAIHRWETP